MDLIASCFERKDDKLNTFISSFQKETCEPFYGFSHIRTKDEMHQIMSIGEHIYKLSHGNYNRYPQIVYKLMIDLSNKTDSLSKLQFRLLKEALEMPMQ